LSQVCSFTDNKLLGAAIFILSGIFFVGYFLLKDRVDSKSDLVEINNAVVDDFSFTENRGIRNHTFWYYLTLRPYKCEFQIMAGFNYLFEKDSFERNIKKGDKINIEISRHDFKNINNKETVELFGISDSSMIYLDSKYSIGIYNDDFPKKAGLCLILGGLILFYFNRDKIKTTANTG